jgi:mitogen-activated protein kinase kinase kinase 9
MALEAARGVHYLHSCNPPVLHRDLKSLNLLLDESGRVKLADFGWTKGLDNYMTGKIGTYQWMAPEVIASQKYSEKADVFSYGIILWEIASREPPFKRTVSPTQISPDSRSASRSSITTCGRPSPRRPPKTSPS